MNWLAFTLGGVLLGTAAYLILSQHEGTSFGGRRRGDQPPVEELAHQLEHAWADHHTTT